MRVIYHDSVNKLALRNARPAAALEALLEAADVVSLHVPETPSTHGMMGTAELAHMTPGTCLINASRGTVVEIDALVEALRSGRLAGAALDVFPQEPKPSEVARSAQNNWRAKQQDRPNQLYSAAGPALVSPMMGQVGSGGVRLEGGSPFGNRFGNYVTILRQRVAEKWHTGDVDPRIHTLPPAIVTFELMRDGSVRNVHVAQSSGNQAADYSAQRAIYDASPFPALPAAYDRDAATIEFWFELRR